MKSVKTVIIEPVWGEIEKARIQISQFLNDQHLAEDFVHAATMVFSELIENSVKYGNYRTGDRVETSIKINGHLITIEVIHPINPADLEHLRQLDEIIQWIRGYQDPFEAYIEKLKEIAKKPIADKDSGLGLVRMAYEGGAILDFFIDEDRKLNVSAVLKY